MQGQKERKRAKHLLWHPVARQSACAQLNTSGISRIDQKLKNDVSLKCFMYYAYLHMFKKVNYLGMLNHEVIIYMAYKL